MILFTLFCLAFPLYTEAVEVEFSVLDDQRVKVSVDGELFAQFIPDFNHTPVIWPILSGKGVLMTRSYPMVSEEFAFHEGDTDPKWQNLLSNCRYVSIAEEIDHPHQRSIWFDHGEVNGEDFWSITNHTQVNSTLISAEKIDEYSVVLKTKNLWNETVSGDCYCEDIRTITFGILPESSYRYIDYDIDLTAVADEVLFGDTKEGSFGVRIPGSMDVNALARNPHWGGTIVNSEGLEGDSAWGKPASWVNYSGPVFPHLTDEELQCAQNGEFVPTMTEAGILLMNHPSSFRYPSRYHVRGYGLFAVNPFALDGFGIMGEGSGALTLKKGEKLSFRYRVLFYDGKITAKDADQLFDQYSRTH